jgi:hypothetical protein
MFWSPLSNGSGAISNLKFLGNSEKSILQSAQVDIITGQL